MRDIYYIGNSLHMADFLKKASYFSLKGIISEKKKRNDEFQKYCEYNGIVLKYVETKDDIVEICNSEIIETAVMYDFGIIIPQTVINRVNIYNFHPGNLRTNRGGSPINWSILLNENETVMSLYKITEKIDLGMLVVETKCEISKEDIPSTLKKKLESLIPVMLISLENYIEKGLEGEIITGGIYRNRIREEDYTIDAIHDTMEIIQAKIRSQADYNGAVFMNKGEKVYIKSFEEWKRYINEKKFH